MDVKRNILEAVGHTPLVKLNKVVEQGSAEILAKCEFMNPTGSIKDRMALYIIEQAENNGMLKSGGTIVENTSGNTGLGIAMVAAVKGYRCIFTIPDKMSLEKINMLKAFGAEVVVTPTDVPGDSPQHYVETAKRIAKETPNAFYVNQYHNLLNIEAHYAMTAQEIWSQTDGKLDAMVAGVGTGGTLSGIGRYLKEKDRKIKIIGVDPLGSIHYHYFYTQTLATPHVYKVEGIGEDILCQAMDFSVVDEMWQVDDKESFLMARRLVREEGLFCGGSSGSAVVIALKVAKELGPGKSVVTILPDSGNRYISKYLSDNWMQDYGFLEKSLDLGLVEDILNYRQHFLVLAKKGETVAEVIERLKKYSLAQIPVVDERDKLVAILHEVDILRSLRTGKLAQNSPIDSIMQPLSGIIYPKARAEELYKIFEVEQMAIVVDSQKILGTLSKLDLIEYMAKMLPKLHLDEAIR